MQNSKTQPSVFDSIRSEIPPPIDILNEVQEVNPISEPDFLADGHYAPVRRLEDAPSPEESTVEDPAGRSRSLRMQWRFMRTLVFAAWIFYRLLFWQVYMVKLFPRWVERNNIKRWQRYAREYSRFAIAMGGVFIKLGQFISTRVDILPEEIIRELESLQDTVPTIRFSKIQSVIESEIGPIDARYEYFKQEPIAAASLGQVHKARLLDGEKVVVKVQRPGIREICYTDLAAMRVVARFAMRFSFVSNRSDAVALVEEFGRVFLEELSYKHEAYNAARFGEMFKENMGVYIPAVYYEHSTDQILTIEDVTSIKINDYAALDEAGISRKAVARRLMDTYLQQVFNEYFFHADPHPGNLFIYPLPVEEGQKERPFYLIFVDFGMTGTLSKEIADGMVSTLSSVLNRDARGLVDAYMKLGFILPNADTDRIVEATNKAFDEVWGLSMADMRDVDFERVTDLADEFSDLMLSMPFYIPQDFLYLGRTISILSGMSTSLDPAYNPWQELQPYTEVLIARGFGHNVEQGEMLKGGLARPIMQSVLSGDSKVLQTVGQEFMRRTLPPQITRVDDTMQMLQDGNVHVIADLSLAHRQQLRRIEKENRRIGRSVFFGSIMISATLLYTSGETGVAITGYVLCGLTVLMGLFKD